MNEKHIEILVEVKCLNKEALMERGGTAQAITINQALTAMQMVEQEKDKEIKDLYTDYNIQRFEINDLRKKNKILCELLEQIRSTKKWWHF